MNRIIVQALYVAKSGKTYRSQTKAVDEGQELFDFENELKYQLAMKDYPVEFVNEHGHRQFIQPTDLETVIAAQYGYEQPAPAMIVEEKLEPIPAEVAERQVQLYSEAMNIPQWAAKKAEQESVGQVRVAVDPATPDGVVLVQLDEQGKFNARLPFPEPPRQKVRVKSNDPDNETTQEIPLPFAAIEAVARITGPVQPRGAAYAPFSGPIKVGMGAGTDPTRLRP